jgi:hypothetical protein
LIAVMGDDMSDENSLEVWRQKLDHLRKSRAIASNAAQQFELDKQIEEAERQIVRLEREKQTQQSDNLADLILKGLAGLLGGGGTSSPGQPTNAANLSGTWHGTDGLSYNITHMGNRITFRGIHPQHGEASAGEGQVQGNQLNVAFRTIYGAAGQGTLEISGDDQRLTGRVLDQISGSPMLLTLMRS